MKRISSRQTFFMKWVLPVILVVIALVPVGFIYLDQHRFYAGAVIPSVLVLLFLFFVYPRLVLALADEVYDGGDYLLVKRGRLEDRIPLSDIMNVSVSTLVNPPRITLRLAKRSRFGDEVVFSPPKPLTLNPFARNAVADNLIARVDAARSQRKKP